MREQIVEIYQKFPDHYTRKIQKNTELLAWIETQFKESSYTFSLKEKIVSVVKNISPVCEFGNKRRFISFDMGFGFCGKFSNCVCQQRFQTQFQQQLHQNRTPEQKKQIQNKTQATLLEKYGTNNTFNSSQIKEKIRETNIKKYGFSVPSKSIKVKQKTQETNIKKYGSHPSNTLQVKEKYRQTLQKKYGINSPFESEKFKNKAKQTFLKNYGVDHNWKSPEIRNKIRETNIKKYGSNFYMQRHIPPESMEILSNEVLFKNIITGLTLKEIREKILVDRTTITNYCKKYQCRDLIKFDNSSRLEEKIKKFCEENQIEFQQNTHKIIPPLELDFYFPASRTAVECHGLYWHSEIAGGKDKNYHYNKWKLCKEKGIDLYQYFEDEIESSFEIIASKILYINQCHPGNKIGARPLKINYLNNYQAESQFYQTNHIQKFIYNRTHTIGAWLDNCLVGCMSLRLDTIKNQAEIVRFATDVKRIYSGLFDRMLCFFIRSMDFKGNFFSWSDNRHSNGGVYEKNGFKILRHQPPSYFVTDYEKRYRREHFMKNKIKQRHPEVDLSKTERDLTLELGYDWIWDAGKTLWQKSV